MTNRRYAELYDSWFNGNRTWVAEELLTESKVNMADFMVAFTSDTTYFEAAAIVKLMIKADRKQREAKRSKAAPY